MSQYNSKLIIAKNIKLNKNYTEVLSYSESQMLSLVNDNSIYTSSDFSFLRPNDRYIEINVPVGRVMQGNYIAFQNPYFSNKWFFAFIDNIEFISDNATRIRFTIDVFSTWFDYWDPKACFIIRQHTTNDSVGANLVDEKFDLGDYVINGSITNIQNQFLSMCYYVQASSKADNDAPGGDNRGGVTINGTMVLDDVKKCLTTAELKATLDDATTSTRDVLNAWLVPEVISANRNANNQIESTFGTSDITSPVIPMPTNLNGYTPINNKLLSYPYIALVLSNNDGKSNVLRYEYFTGARTFECWYSATPGCPGFVYPNNYKGADNLLEGISTAPVPVIPYATDSYKAWLNNSAFKREATGFSVAAKIGAGVSLLATGQPLLGTGLALTGISNAFDSVIADTMAQIQPDSFFNNDGIGNLLLPKGLLSPVVYPMSIKSQFARRIDDFFTRYGYATNEIASPNITHRSNFNYILVSSDSSPCIINNHNNICIPNDDLSLINSLFRQGITIWHNHSNLGNYNVSNTIV